MMIMMMMMRKKTGERSRRQQDRTTPEKSQRDLAEFSPRPSSQCLLAVPSPLFPLSLVEFLRWPAGPRLHRCECAPVNPRAPSDGHGGVHRDKGKTSADCSQPTIGIFAYIYKYIYIYTYIYISSRVARRDKKGKRTDGLLARRTRRS